VVQRKSGKTSLEWRSFRQLVAQIREDYRAHQAFGWTAPGFRAIAIYRIGVWVHDPARTRIVSAIGRRIYRLLYVYVRNHYTIELPHTTKVGRRLVIAHQGGIVIHYLSQIGDDCLIHQNVTLGAATEETIERCPILGNRVEVGAGAALVGGVVIGDDVRIGPNAVVTLNVPTGSTVVAPPPRIFQLRKPPLPCSTPRVNTLPENETVSQ
jgi:serine O-acetyltransferase